MKSPIKTHKVENDVMTVELEGSLEITVQKPLRDGLEKLAIEQSDIVLDFSSVSFVDSSCLGSLVSLARTLREKDGDLRVAGLRDDVLSIFQITRLDRVFKIFDDVPSAVESYFK